MLILESITLMIQLSNMEDSSIDVISERPILIIFKI